MWPGRVSPGNLRSHNRRGFHQELRAGPGADPGCPAAFCLCTPSSDCGRREPQQRPPHPEPSPSFQLGFSPSRGKRQALDTWRCRVRAPGQSLRDRPQPLSPLSTLTLAPGSVSLSWAAQALRRALCARGGFQLALCEPSPKFQPTPTEPQQI